MKKVIILAALFLASCEKENQSCGLIIDDNVQDGSIEKHVLYPGDWVNAHVGSEICINK